MIQPPKQPSKSGGVYEYIRQQQEHSRQRGAAMYGGMTTTKGFIPNRTKKVAAATSSPDTDPVWS